VDIGQRPSFADLAATLADLAGLRRYRGRGRSFAPRLLGRQDS